MTPSELLLAHDDFVRRLARSLLRDVHRADDVAQETWLAVLRGQPRGLRSVRAWLAAVVRNLAARSVRDQESARRLEPRGARAESLPAVDELLAREAQRRQLVESVVGLAEPYREALILRFFDQLPPRAIARRLQVPVETVRTRIKRGLKLLRARLDAEHGGDGTQWLRGLAAFWPARPGATAAATLLTTFTGVLLMSAKMKLLAAAAALGVLLVGWWSLGGLALGGAPRPPGDDPATVAAASLPARTDPPPTSGSPVPMPASLRVAPPSTKGGLRVTVVYGVDGARAAHAWLSIVRFDPRDSWFLERKDAQSGADGTLTAEEEDPGALVLYAYQGGSERVEVHAGKLQEATLTIPPGVDVTGEVVDAQGAPVAGAGIWLGDEPGRIVVTTAADGTFALRSVEPHALLGAVAEGHGPSRRQHAEGKPGMTVRMRFVLDRPWVLTGRVVDPEDRPVRGARVLVGYEGRAILGAGEISPPGRLLTTDAQGAFRLEGLRTRESYPVRVRAPGFAPWSGACYPGTPMPLQVQLARGVALAGTVRNEQGQPVPDARVTVGGFRAFDSARTTTAADGTYRLPDLPTTPFQVSARLGEALTANAELRGDAGTEVRWDPVLSAGHTLAGVVVDENGNALPGWRVVADRMVQGNPHFAAHWTTDAAGRFALEHLRNENHRVTVFEPGADQRFPAVLVAGTTIGQSMRIVVPSGARATARIEGVVLGPDGMACQATTVWVQRQHFEALATVEVQPGTGRFRSGPLPPGMYSLWVRATKDLPELKLPLRELEPDETWDTGTLELGRPGVVVVHLTTPSGKAPGGAFLRYVHESGNTVTSHPDGEPPYRSPPLLPGSWRLSVSCHPLIADELPFAIRPGEESQLVVRMRQGARRTFEVGWDGKAPQRVRLVVRDRAGRTWIDFDTAPTDATLRVAPTLDVGDYDVHATADDGRKASATFAIRDVAVAREPIELKLR